MLYIHSTGHLTHWGQVKMSTILQTTFSNAFSGMKTYEFWLRFHWSFFLRLELTIFQHWFRWWFGAYQAASHFLNQWWLVYWSIYASLGLKELMGPKYQTDYLFYHTISFVWQHTYHWIHNYRVYLCHTIVIMPSINFAIQLAIIVRQSL